MDKRHLVQALWAAATNSYLKGFASAKIYGGKLKFACVPGLSCSSCPGALGTCPIGALQSVLDSGKFKFSCYCFGFLMLVGALCGRFACGWLCPFGLVQDLLDKIPARKIRTFKGDKPLRYLKYAVLVVLVLLLPMLITNVIGQGEPWFCKWLCPSGTLMAGIPLVALDSVLRSTISWLYAWKVFILVFLLELSIFIYRPFCKYLCPLGAIYGLFNRFSLIKTKPHAACAHCKMGCKPNDRECIRCRAKIARAPQKPVSPVAQQETQSKNA